MKPLLSVEELASAVGIQTRMVRRYIAKEGILPQAIAGRRNLYPRGAVETIRQAILVGREYRRQMIRQAVRARHPDSRVLSMEELQEQAAKGGGR